MKITVKLDGFDALRANLASMAKQMPFAASVALNATAKKVADAMPAEIERAIDRPTAFTKRSVRLLRRATKTNLEATVGFMDKQAKYMKLQVEGGTVNPGRAGLKLPSAIKVNEYGNIPKGVIAQLVNVARKEKGLRKATAKRIRVSTSVELFYGDPVDHGKPMPRGIYKIANGALIPLIVFPITPARYKKRFDFHAKAIGVVDREWRNQFALAIDQAMRTAR